MYENVQRLTLALYRITERLDDDEPLKWRLRGAALQFEELCGKDSDSLTIKEEKERLGLSRSIISMLELASSLSYIARANFNALLREYALLENRPTVPKVLGNDDNNDNQVNNEGDLTPSELSDRQKEILDSLKRSPTSSMSELVQSLEGKFSERTLQRDLNELISRGMIRFDGNNRWRRYSINY